MVWGREEGREEDADLLNADDDDERAISANDFSRRRELRSIGLIKITRNSAKKKKKENKGSSLPSTPSFPSTPPKIPYHLQFATPVLTIGLALPTPTGSSVNPLILLLQLSCFFSLLFSSVVFPSARRTCNFELWCCFIPLLPRPLMSTLFSAGPFVVHD